MSAISQRSKSVSEDDPEGRVLEDRLARHFNPVVRRARGVILWERLWPKALPSLCAGGLFVSASWLGLWAQLPPAARAAGVVLAAAASLAPFALIKTGSLNPDRADAIKRLDDNLGGPLRPARTLDGSIHENSPELTRHLWNHDRMLIWEQYGSKFRAGKPHPGISARLYGMAAAIALSVLVSGVTAQEHKAERLAQAFNWSAQQSPGSAAAIPGAPQFQIKAWIEAPQYFDEPVISLTGTSDVNGISPHKNSKLTIQTFNPGARVSINGREMKAQEEFLADRLHPDKKTSQYVVNLDEGDTAVVIEDKNHKISWNFTAGPDSAPEVVLKSVTEEENSVVVDYAVRDDHGVIDGNISMRPLRNIAPDATPLPSAALPAIPMNLPAQSPP